MLSEELISILVCPESRQPLHLASDAFLEKVKEEVAKGSLLNAAGEKVSISELSGLLVRDDGKISYPILNDIPVLLIESGILTESVAEKLGVEAIY